RPRRARRRPRGARATGRRRKRGHCRRRHDRRHRHRLRAGASTSFGVAICFPRASDIAVNLPVLAAVSVLSALAAAAASLMPAPITRRLDLTSALVDQSAASAAGAWQSRSGRLRTIVMTVQVAVTCLLLVGAALLTRSFVALMHADRGYDPANVLTAR